MKFHMRLFTALKITKYHLQFPTIMGWSAELKLYPIHASKTCYVKSGLTELKSET